jgi:hypothetical protein
MCAHALIIGAAYCVGVTTVCLLVKSLPVHLSNGGDDNCSQAVAHWRLTNADARIKLTSLNPKRLL